MRAYSVWTFVLDNVPPPGLCQRGTLTKNENNAQLKFLMQVLYDFIIHVNYIASFLLV